MFCICGQCTMHLTELECPVCSAMCRSQQSALANVILSIPESNRLKLDKEVDFENKDLRGQTVPKHLGKIAAAITGWEGAVADELGLSETDKEDIREKYQQNPVLRRREALSVWKRGLGTEATYRALIQAFIRAGQVSYAQTVADILSEEEDMSDSAQHRPAMTSPQVATGLVGASGTMLVTGAGTPTCAGLHAQTLANSGGSKVAYDRPAHCFLASMTPYQLAHWLLQEYGDDYQEEIDKLRRALINGELFLDLPEDNELLQGLNLSPAFKKLIVKKAKQSKETSGVSASVPERTANGEASLPLASQECKKRIPRCTAVNLDDQDVDCGSIRADSIEPDEDALSAWVPRNVIWRGRKELGVKFLYEIPDGWTYAGKDLNTGNVMSWANVWSHRGEGIIPSFTEVKDANAPSDIKVVFNTNGWRESLVGKKAEKVKHDKPTMWLDLHSDWVDDDYKRFIVIHEFGHALGLCHEHQRSDFWRLVKPHIDVVSMKADLNISDEDFEKDWDRDKAFGRGEATEYDPHSIMHYWFQSGWLKNGYSDKNKVEQDRDSGVLSPEVAQALLGVHARNNLADKPSDKDIQLLKDLYSGNVSCTILGPPPVNPPRPKVSRVMSDDGGSQESGGDDEFNQFRLAPTHLCMLEWKSRSSSEPNKVKVCNTAQAKWKIIAGLLGLEYNDIQDIDRRSTNDHECVEKVFDRWLKNANSLPNKKKYPKKWTGLIRLLRDSELGELAEDLKKALSAPYSDVRGNLC